MARYRPKPRKTTQTTKTPDPKHKEDHKTTTKDYKAITLKPAKLRENQQHPKPDLRIKKPQTAQKLNRTNYWQRDQHQRTSITNQKQISSPLKWRHLPPIYQELRFPSQKFQLPPILNISLYYTLSVPKQSTHLHILTSLLD